MHPHDAGMTKPVDGSGLVQEALESPVVEFLASGRGDGDARAVCSSSSVGEVLLESNRSIQQVVEREVGDAEAAGAEHTDDLVLVDPKARR